MIFVAGLHLLSFGDVRLELPLAHLVVELNLLILQLVLIGQSESRGLNEVRSSFRIQSDELFLDGIHQRFVLPLLVSQPLVVHCDPLCWILVG